MTKRKTVYHQMFLVDPILYNRINNNSSANNISNKQTPTPMHPLDLSKQTQFVEIKDSIPLKQTKIVETNDSLPPSQGFKSEFAKSLIENNLTEKQSSWDPHARVHSTEMKTNQNIHPTRVDAVDTETYKNMDESIQPKVQMPGSSPPQQTQGESALHPQVRSALLQSAFHPGIVGNDQDRQIMLKTNNAANQNVECMECNDTNHLPLQQHPQQLPHLALPPPSQMDDEISNQFALNYVPQNNDRNYIQYNSYPQIHNKTSKRKQRAVVRYNPFARMQNSAQSESRSIVPPHQLVVQNRTSRNNVRIPSIEINNNENTLHPVVRNVSEGNDTEFPSIEFQNDERALVPARTNAIAHYNQETDVSQSNTSNFQNYQKNKFICLLCNTEFGRKKVLERHMRQIHEAYQQTKKGHKRQKTFSCDICPATFQTQSTLRRHIKNMHEAFFQENKGIKRTLKQKQRPTKYMKYF